MSLKNSGFTLVEILIYSVIFAVATVFLVGVLIAVTGTQLRQTSANEVNQQIYFVSGIIKNAIRESSLIENEAGVAGSSLILRTNNLNADPTLIYLEDGEIYLKEGDQNPISLTTDEVIVTDFQIIKQENPGSLALINVDLTIEHASDASRAKVARTWQSAVGRVSTPIFSGNFMPEFHNSLDIGSSEISWRGGYFSRNVMISGKLGLGVLASNMKLESTGDIGFSNSSAGIVLRAPGGTYYRITINNEGSLQVNEATSFITLNQQKKLSWFWEHIIKATLASDFVFDDHIIPNDHNRFDIGSPGSVWRDAHFSSDVLILGRIGLGTSPSDLINMKIKSTGDIGFSNSSAGIVLRAPGGTYYRITINNEGSLQVNEATSFITLNQQKKLSWFWEHIIKTASAITFDGSIIPSTGDLFDMGSSGKSWRQGFFSRNVQILGNIGLGVSSANMKLESTGDIGIIDSDFGVVFSSSGGSCFRMTVDNGGVLNTNSATCP